VTWVPETQGITVVLGNNQIGLQIGNNTAVVNGNVLSIVPPYIKNGRTMVPLRVIAEGFGAQVEWDPINYIVTITMP
ncbi:copper amine oxidase N-terminal domain-containing protein, partial [Caldisericum sp.]